jgi:hypothetical protein
MTLNGPTRARSGAFVQLALLFTASLCPRDGRRGNVVPKMDRVTSAGQFS